MSTDIITVVPEEHKLPQRREFFSLEPADQVEYAAKLAGVLNDVIEKQKLFSVISGKKYIKAEGWQTLGTFLGVVPKERSVTRLQDGSYEAYVELVKYADGTIVGGASALCSVSEKRWGASDDFARRSMAITRATGKAYRTGFSWIVTLAGYEPTPSEEMPREESKTVENKSNTGIYNSNDASHISNLEEFLEKHPKIPKDKYIPISDALHGKSKSNIRKIVKEVAGIEIPFIGN